MQKTLEKKNSFEQRTVKQEGMWKQGVRRFVKNRAAVVSVFVLALLIVCCILAPYLTRYEYDKVDLYNSMASPSKEHPFGTDVLGRDMLTRILYGGRVSLSIAFRAVAMSLVGLVFGIVSGFFGGKTDALIARINDALASIPMFLLAVFVECFVGWGEGNFVYAIAISFVPPLVRLSRSLVKNIMGSEYIEAARALGVSRSGIMFRHILRNIAAPVTVHVMGTLGEALLTCTLMGYLGIGINPPTAEWGAIVYDGYGRIFSSTRIAAIPCVIIVICVFAMNTIGNGLRDAFAPETGEA